MKIGYKNTNQYWSKCSKKFAENHRFFKIIFEENFLFFFFFRTGPRAAHIAGLNTALSLAQASDLTKPFTRAWNSAKVIK